MSNRSNITSGEQHAVIDMRVAIAPGLSTDPDLIADVLSKVLGDGVSIGVLADYEFYNTDQPLMVLASDNPDDGELFKTKSSLFKERGLSDRQIHALEQFQFWLEDNVNMGTELFFDNDGEVNSEVLLDAVNALIDPSS